MQKKYSGRGEQKQEEKILINKTRTISPTRISVIFVQRTSTQGICTFFINKFNDF